MESNQTCTFLSTLFANLRLVGSSGALCMTMGLCSPQPPTFEDLTLFRIGTTSSTQLRAAHVTHQMHATLAKKKHTQQ